MPRHSIMHLSSFWAHYSLPALSNMFQVELDRPAFLKEFRAVNSIPRAISATEEPWELQVPVRNACPCVDPRPFLLQFIRSVVRLSNSAILRTQASHFSLMPE